MQFRMELNPDIESASEGVIRTNQGVMFTRRRAVTREITDINVGAFAQ